MKKLLFVIIIAITLTSCKKEMTANMPNAFPVFHPSEQDYLNELHFADSIKGSYEYKYTSNWFVSSEKYTLIITVYLDSQQKVESAEINKIKSQLKDSESKISNFQDYDRVKYVLVQKGQEVHTFDEDIKN